MIGVCYPQPSVIYRDLRRSEKSWSLLRCVRSRQTWNRTVCCVVSGVASEKPWVLFTHRYREAPSVEKADSWCLYEECKQRMTVRPTVAITPWGWDSAMVTAHGLISIRTESVWEVWWSWIIYWHIRQSWQNGNTRYIVVPCGSRSWS